MACKKIINFVKIPKLGFLKKPKMSFIKIPFLGFVIKKDTYKIVFPVELCINGVHMAQS
jgi:hypothetical protein